MRGAVKLVDLDRDASLVILIDIDLLIDNSVLLQLGKGLVPVTVFIRRVLGTCGFGIEDKCAAIERQVTGRLDEVLQGRIDLDRDLDRRLMLGIVWPIGWRLSPLASSRAGIVGIVAVLDPVWSSPA